jgi:hypothetical protein
LTGSQLTLLAVLAHPDDESFGLGGTLALYARRGHRVILLCATRGEAGTVDPEYLRGFSSIAELRESELRCAAQHLGLDAVHFLGYRDSGMQGQLENSHPDAQVAHPVEEVAVKVVAHIRDCAGRGAHLIPLEATGTRCIQSTSHLAFQHAADPLSSGSSTPFQRALLSSFPQVPALTRLCPGGDPRRFAQ